MKVLMLPERIGSRVEIASYNLIAKKYLEWHGFVISEGSPEALVMRRDFHSGRHSGDSEVESEVFLGFTGAA